jgi:hypothetical protein
VDPWERFTEKVGSLLRADTAGHTAGCGGCAGLLAVQPSEGLVLAHAAVEALVWTCQAHCWQAIPVESEALLPMHVV